VRTDSAGDGAFDAPYGGRGCKVCRPDALRLSGLRCCIEQFFRTRREL